MLKFACTILFSVAVSTAALADVSIDGYRNAIIAQSDTDMRGIAAMLAANVQKSGLTIYASRADVKEDEAPKTCVIGWSQYGTLTQYCQLTVRDLLTGTVIAHSSEWSRLRFGVPACIKGSVENAWTALKYSGFDERAYLENLKTLVPSRPIFALDEKQIKSMSLTAPIEGIWMDADNTYSIGIIKDPTQKYGDYIGVVLHSSQPIWSPGEIKLELRETATGDAYMANYYMANKSRVGTEIVLAGGGGTFQFDTTRLDGTTERHFWVKIFPKISPSYSSYGPGSSFGSAGSLSEGTPKSSGSGVIVSTKGYVLTAAHVVAGAGFIKVVTVQGTVSATVLSIDEANDLAVLKITGGPYVALPVEPSRAVRLGQEVGTIGFPNPDIQGFSPKVTRGEISSINGFSDDPREWQISVPVQPGNSGGPLLDENGNLVGVVEAKLSLKAAEVTGDLPQNVSYAVKSAYALALLEPYLDDGAPEPDKSSQRPSFEDMVAKAQRSVVMILIY